VLVQTANGGKVAVGAPAPAIVGTTLDGQPFDQASLRGRPVLINFWGPTCVPCRDEFPLLVANLEEHAADGFAVIGVLNSDPVDMAKQFVTTYGGTWPTVQDPDHALRVDYRVAAFPTSYFVDRDGVVRSIQQGYLTDPDFERQYARIAAPSSSAPSTPTAP
jgi:cytochrome c biogenesis protein CcmG/thiol:disulfide interchange protein DsbE